MLRLIFRNSVRYWSILIVFVLNYTLVLSCAGIHSITNISEKNRNKLLLRLNKPPKYILNINKMDVAPRIVYLRILKCFDYDTLEINIDGKIRKIKEAGSYDFTGNFSRISVEIVSIEGQSKESDNYYWLFVLW